MKSDFIWIALTIGVIYWVYTRNPLTNWPSDCEVYPWMKDCQYTGTSSITWIDCNSPNADPVMCAQMGHTPPTF